MSKIKRKKNIAVSFFSMGLIAILLLTNVLAVGATEELIPTEKLKEESAKETAVLQDDAKSADDELTTAADQTQVTAPNWIPKTAEKNGWQIVAEKYVNNNNSSKKGCDLDGDKKNDIFYQKNVIPSDIENEFFVYMGITKRMTWDELLAESTLGLTTQGKWTDSDVGKVVSNSEIGGNKSNVLQPGKGGSRNYLATIHLVRGGKEIRTFQGWYNGTTPKASNCTGYIMLKGLDNKSLIASAKVNLHQDGNGTGGTLEYTIDLDEMEKANVHYSVEEIITDSVVDQMGSYITYEGIVNSDGDVTSSGDTITWIPKSNGATGLQVMENGVLTGYHHNIHQLVYKVHLKVEQSGFNSCAQNMNSKVGEGETYPVNTKAVLNCHLKDTQKKANPEFQVPYVRGLLYDIEFQKLAKDSKIPLDGIEFTVERKVGGSTIAESLEVTDKSVTDENGWIKIHNLPWGTYEIKETAIGGSLKDYINETVPKTVGTENICWTTRPSALANDHAGQHKVDSPKDVKNMLLKFKGGTYENELNNAKITVVKHVKYFDKLSGKPLAKQKYTVNTKGSDIYLKPAATDTEFKKLDETTNLGHTESKTYELVVPKNGGEISVDEIIPDEVKRKIAFDSVKVTQGSDVKNDAQGCKVKVMPGSEVVVDIYNTPMGTIKIKKVINNYSDKLKDDAFIIKAVSTGDNGKAVNVETVLNHNGISDSILVKNPVTVNISEIVPKEYSMKEIEVAGGGILSGNNVKVEPGEEVLITVRNEFSAKPFFHVSDQVKNAFRWK